MNKSTDLVIQDDNKIVFVAKQNLKTSTTSLQVHSNNKISKKETKIALYQKLLEREEFKRPETKGKILQDEDYLCKLEELIRRDYYPSLIIKENNKVNNKINKRIK